jgi:hypothetical protein
LRDIVVKERSNNNNNNNNGDDDGEVLLEAGEAENDINNIARHYVQYHVLLVPAH